MSNGTQPMSSEPVLDTIRRYEGDDAKIMSALYDEYAGVVLGLLRRLTDDHQKAEELLQAVFLALPSRVGDFDPEQGRFVSWILRLARSVAMDAMKTGNAPTNSPIRKSPQNVHASNTNPDQAAAGLSIVELLYVKGYTFTQAAAELGIEEHAVRTLVRNELKSYRSGNPHA